jgi:DNA-directed RNA polymerase specialized sigma54-like protein
MAQKTLAASALMAAVATIDPDAAAVGTYNTVWISMSDFQVVQAVVMAGALGAAATLDAKLEQALDSAGTGAKDLVDAAITQLTKANADDNKQAIIECFGEDLDIENDFTHVRLSLSIGVANSDCAAIVMGLSPRHGAASDNDAASVSGIVTV